jgi:transcriptional regulator with XRE-family HTH domain
MKPDEIRDAVKMLRAALGLSQERLARRLNVTLRTVARWETAGEKLPPMTLNRLRLFALHHQVFDAATLFEAKMREHLDWEFSEIELEYTPQTREEYLLVVDVLKRCRSGRRPMLTWNKLTG